MKNDNFVYSGWKTRGLPMLLVTLALLGVGIWLVIEGGIRLDAQLSGGGGLLAAGIVLCLAAALSSGGFMLLEPNEARVMLFFGQYRGTFYETGYWWVNQADFAAAPQPQCRAHQGQRQVRQPRHDRSRARLAHQTR